jgi:hypothetical protein
MEQVKAEKWNERVEAFAMVVTCCGSPPKIIPGDYSSLINKLKESVNDKMIAVAIAAVNTIGVVADGLGSEFGSYGKGEQRC